MRIMRGLVAVKETRPNPQIPKQQEGAARTKIEIEPGCLDSAERVLFSPASEQSFHGYVQNRVLQAVSSELL